MTVDQRTLEELRGIVEGRTNHALLNPVTKRLIEILICFQDHREEIDALSAAEVKKPEKLAKLIEAKGELRLPEARRFVAARLRGENKKRSKPTISVFGRVQIFLRVLDLKADKGMTLSAAIEKLIDDGHTASNSFDTVKSDFYRGRDELREVLKSLGLPAGPALQND